MRLRHAGWESTSADKGSFVRAEGGDADAITSRASPSRQRAGPFVKPPGRCLLEPGDEQVLGEADGVLEDHRQLLVRCEVEGPLEDAGAVLHLFPAWGRPLSLLD